MPQALPASSSCERLRFQCKAACARVVWFTTLDDPQCCRKSVKNGAQKNHLSFHSRAGIGRLHQYEQHPSLKEPYGSGFAPTLFLKEGRKDKPFVPQESWHFLGGSTPP